jgi:hypothetical protein
MLKMTTETPLDNYYRMIRRLHMTESVSYGRGDASQDFINNAYQEVVNAYKLLSPREKETIAKPTRPAKAVHLF